MFQRSMMWMSAVALFLLLFPAPSTEGQSLINRVTVGANYSRYSGPCPAHLRFTANIYVDRYPRSYNYEWERSDGAKSGLHIVRVNNPSQQHIILHEDWQLSAHGEVWEGLRVRSGNTDVTAEPARVFVECH